MIQRLIVAFTAIASSAVAITSCPTGFDLMNGDKCIKPLALWVSGTLPTLFDDMLTTCETAKGHLPIIKSAQENTNYNTIVASYADIKDENVYLVLGMVYNATTKQLQWEDKSAVTYKGPNGIDITTNRHVVSEVKQNSWYAVPDAAVYNYTFLCETAAIEQNLDAQCGEYEFMDVSEDEDKPCIKVFADKLGWRAAEEYCKEDFGKLATIHSDTENQYIRRVALGAGVAKGGMHIGATATVEDPKTYFWVDGEVTITNNKKVYDNFIDGFPFDGLGIRSAMITENTKGEWINADDDSDELPYVCRRVKYPSPVTTCPDTAPIDTDFYPPGFPNSNIACEYLLTVPAGHLVQLEVLALETNKDEDFLEIYEGFSDTPNVTLSGLTPVAPDDIIRTVTSNMMRVNWLPKGTPVVRGFRLKYTAIDPPPAPTN